MRLNPKTSLLLREKDETFGGGGDVKMKTETGIIRLQAENTRDYWQPLEVCRAHRSDSPSEPSQGADRKDTLTSNF